MPPRRRQRDERAPEHRERVLRTPHLPPDRPQVVAHRGASAVKAEHTLGAYLAALDEGAEALECDIRLTADGHLVCVHDRDLLRTANRHGLVSTTELADLDRLDFASWKNPWADLDDEQEEPDPELVKVLTLRRLLETVADYPRRVDLAIETKHPTRFGGLVERRLVELLATFGWTGPDSPVRVMSFSAMALKRVEKLAPALDLVFLIDAPGEWAIARAIGRRDWIAGPGVALLRTEREAIRKIAERHRVHCWTVNTEADVELCRELGVEAVITDRPGATLRYLVGPDGSVGTAPLS
ncbi:MAG: Glycerophosphoryl diester phosphodiesterase [Nocardioidaceae bacterium]|nr:Glycerophosphoryl diester phosphodiesterase [Nocardioidaceae bacterium]